MLLPIPPAVRPHGAAIANMGNGRLEERTLANESSPPARCVLQLQTWDVKYGYAHVSNVHPSCSKSSSAVDTVSRASDGPKPADQIRSKSAMNDALGVRWVIT